MAGLGAHPLADLERVAEQRFSVARAVPSALRDLPRVADLAEDLGLAEHGRVETRGHREEVTRGALVEVAVEVVGRARRDAGRRGRAMKSRTSGVRAVEPLGDDVDLGAVAGRQHHGLGDVRPRAEVVERLGKARTVDTGPLEQLERCDAVVQTDDDDRHAGWRSFSSRGLVHSMPAGSNATQRASPGTVPPDRRCW